MAIGPTLVDTLRGWRVTQQLEAAEWGEAWTDSGCVFAAVGGRPPHPGRWLSKRFKALTAAGCG